MFQVVQEFVLGEYDEETTAAFNQNISEISTLEDPRSKDASQRFVSFIGRWTRWVDGKTCFNLERALVRGKGND